MGRRSKVQEFIIYVEGNMHKQLFTHKAMMDELERLHTEWKIKKN